MKSILEMTPEEDAADDARMAKTGKIYQELVLLLDWPPFSLDERTWNRYADAVNNPSDPEADDPWKSVKSKFADEIEEARMYQKRYGDDAAAATRAAAKIQGG